MDTPSRPRALPALPDPVTADVLDAAHRLAAEWLDTLQERPVRAAGEPDGLRAPLTDAGEDPVAVVEALAAAAAPGLVASPGPRYFGFVTGATLPAALGADWLTSAWDQNAALHSMSPAAASAEQAVGEWMLDLLGLPPHAGFGIVTGAQMANATALAAARHAVLRDAGWDVEANGLSGAPPLRVITGGEAHSTVYNALRLLGLGGATAKVVPADEQGRMRAGALAELLAEDAEAPTIVCAQAGNVNTGACDPLGAICDAAAAAGAWVHVDGAFGLWAAAAPARAALVDGAARADSWAVDAHKWLNVPYDSGVAFVRDGAALYGAMTVPAPYLTTGGAPEPCHATPEMSRRARAVEIWAALRTLGRAGVAELVERACRHAARFAERLRAGGCEILNDVVLNQVLVAFGDDARTDAVVAAVQRDGTAWCGPTVWQGRRAMRISVSSWATSETDVERVADTILRCYDGASHKG